MPLITDFSLRLLATLTATKDLGNTPSSPLDVSQRIKLASGTAAGQADRLFYDERQLAASATEDLDLVGSLVDDFGAVFSPARIKMLWIKAASLTLPANTNNVIVGAAAATQWAALLGTTGTVTLRPGAQFLAAAGDADATGYVCAAGATDLLKIANSGAGSVVNYQIVVIGCSA